MSEPLHTLARWTLALLTCCLVVWPALHAQAEDDIATDRYEKSGLSLLVLKPEERRRFVKLATEELCPCEGIFDSLDACLQRERAGCPLAGRVAVMSMRNIKEGLSDLEVRDALVRYVEQARKVHTFNLEKTPHKGAAPSKAKLKIIEFADFECPHCRVGSAVLADVAKDHADMVTVYFKHFPLRMHPNARIAAHAAVAAHAQGKFWPMHDRLMEHQDNLNPDTIREHAEAVGLDMARFDVAMKDDATHARVDADRAEGEAAELTGTPGIFINGVRYDGPLRDLPQVIEDRLKTE